MKEPGKKNDFLVRWGLRKLSKGWTYEQVVAGMKKMRGKSLKEIKELVKQ